MCRGNWKCRTRCILLCSMRRCIFPRIRRLCHRRRQLCAGGSKLSDTVCQQGEYHNTTGCIPCRQQLFKMQSRNNPKITVVTKHVPVRVVDDGMRVTGLVIRNVDTNVETEMKTHGIFPYIGLDPATSFLEGLGILDERGYMIVDENCETKAKGIYGAGDVIAKNCARLLRQPTTEPLRHSMHFMR